jgi:hypothetical protein
MKKRDEKPFCRLSDGLLDGWKMVVVVGLVGWYV